MMRFPPFLAFLLPVCCAFAEGSRELAPNANIVINGNNTTDIAALLLGHPNYNSFAVYWNDDPNSRLYIHIADPETECIFLGFSFGHPNFTGTNPPRIQYEYRVRDPEGNIVFGPVNVTTAGAGIENWSQAVTGPGQIHGAGGYNAAHVTSADLTSQGWTGKGDYFVEFNNVNSTEFLIDFWDITVARCDGNTITENPGRVWSYNWALFAINDYGFPNRPFNGAYYVCAPDPDDPDAAFITRIDFNGAGFQPAAFNIAFNSFGSFNTGNVSYDRRSVELVNATQAEYAIFLNDPLDLCKTAEPGDLELLGISRCAGDDYCIKFIATKEGQIDLLLDFDGPDDIYTPGTRDVMLTALVDASQAGVPSCIFWNGRDGLGNTIPEDASTEIPVVIAFTQGIYHFPIYDAEYMVNGFTIQNIRPASPPPLLYYDDSAITVPSGSGEPPVQLSGCVLPCHRWTNFVNDNVVGFGNRNTINSWWFSQRVVRTEIYFLPAYIACLIEGPSSLCEGTTATLTVHTEHFPEDFDAPEIVAQKWSGPEITGSAEGSTITIGGGGIYTVEVYWLTALGDTCVSSCEITVLSDPISYGFIDTLILSGATVEINGEVFSEGGEFIQVLTAANGCDSILTITITMLQTVVYYSLDACLSVPAQGSDMDYSEFTPEYPDPLNCAGLTASHGFRENPQENKHSCTPGVEGSPAICVSSLDDCTYDPENDKAFVFEITVVPVPDTAVAITHLIFYERSPEMYEWINGPSGPNNYPTLYGLRVLKNGMEIYRAEDVPATADWTLESYAFAGIEEFIVTDSATFRFEFLGYCLVGNGADVAAWDMDEIRVLAACVSPHRRLAGSIAGRVLTEFGRRISGAEISLSETQGFEDPRIVVSDAGGAYIFPENLPGDQYYLRAKKNTGFLEGVNTLDMILIQKHLLGIKLFDSPLQYLAADVSGNDAISALDIVILRKLILGIIAEFPENRSWLFGRPDQDLPLFTPWDFEETIVVSRDDLNRQNVNFLAVKIGDVNGSVNNLVPKTPIRSNLNLRLWAEEHMMTAGIQTIIDITADALEDLHGFQCALQLRGLQLLAVQDGLLTMADAWALDEKGVLRISWFDSRPLDIYSGDVLFRLVVIPATDGLLSEMVTIVDAGLHAEAYTGSDATDFMGLTLEFSSRVPVYQENQLFQNIPNPFSSETEIPFWLAHAGKVTLAVYTATGEIVWEHTAYFDTGMHRAALPRIIPASGVLIYQLRGEDFLLSRKMIGIE